MKNKTTKMLAIFSMCGAILATGIPVCAASGYESFHTTVGNTAVTMEVGFNNSTGYAKVSANNYVDATMDGNVYYFTPTGSATLSGSFSERTYGEVSRNVSGSIYMVDCDFTVTSSDGSSVDHYCYAD